MGSIWIGSWAVFPQYVNGAFTFYTWLNDEINFSVLPQYPAGITKALDRSVETLNNTEQFQQKDEVIENCLVGMYNPGARLLSTIDHSFCYN